MRVLVVDDDLGSRLIAQAVVEALGHDCRCAADGDAAWELFLAYRPDVVVSDRAMPGLDGVQLCRAIRDEANDAYTYVILVTSLTDPEDIIAGMEAGADDYLTKPLSAFDLRTRLLAARRVTELHAELSRTRGELAKQARTDPLTGLRNRLALREELEWLHATSQRYHRGYCIALCDVDHFKLYNDTYGHQAGDQALRAVAAVLIAQTRDVDASYRYGGEEFLVVLPEQRAEGAMIAVERVRAAVEKLQIPHAAGGPEGVLTLSVGLADWPAQPTATSDALLLQADRALYAAKHAGRNTVVQAGVADRAAAL